MGKRICCAHLQLKHEGLTRAVRSRRVLSSRAILFFPRIRSSILETARETLVPEFDNYFRCLRLNVRRVLARLPLLLSIMTGTPRARSGAATSVHTHARLYPRGVSQGLVFCFSAYRLPCTPCYSAGTKPATIRLRSRTSCSWTSATPASDRAWRCNKGANLVQYSRWRTLDSEYMAVFCWLS